MNLLYLQWHITGQCNNRCLHCYQDHYHKDDIKLDDARTIISDFNSACLELNASSFVSITGGDPLLHNEFLEIVSLTSSQCDRVRIMGNPELLMHNSKDIIPKLKELGISEWQLSLDGLEKTHDSIRYKGSFVCTLRAIETLVKVGINVSIMSTVNSCNFKEIPTLMEFLYSKEIFSWSFARHIPKYGHCGINPLGYKDFLIKVRNLHQKYEKEGHPTLNRESLIHALKNEVENSEKFVSGCGLGTSSICLLPDKTVMACRRLPDSILGKWSLEEGFLFHFLFNPKMQKYREREVYGECGDCNYFYSCRGCRAAAFKAHGHISKNDPQCWIINDRRSQNE